MKVIMFNNENNTTIACYKNHDCSEDKEIITNFSNMQKPIKDYSQYQTSCYKLRAFIIEWLYLINSKLNGSPLTLFQAIGMFDRYLEKQNNKRITGNDLQLYGAVCYFISSKLEEVTSFNMIFLKRVLLKDKFEISIILQTELDILKILNFKLQTPTIQTFTELILFYINSDCKDTLRHLNYMVNIISQFVNELIFDISPFFLALTTIKTSLLILADEMVLKDEDVNNINDQVDNMINYAKYCKEEIEEISESLYETFKIQRNNIEKKEFLKIFNECTKVKFQNYE
jgi:hypothetical protein